MEKPRSIEKTYTKIKLKEQKTDFEFWQSQEPEKRLATLEKIRLEFHAWTYESQPRLQRVFSIVQRK